MMKIISNVVEHDKYIDILSKNLLKCNDDEIILTTFNMINI